MARVKQLAQGHRRYSARRGQTMIEMIITLVMFVLMLTAVTSMSTYLYVQHATVTAAREGARFASLNDDLSDPANQSAAEAEVADYVANMVTQTTGIAVDPDEVAVTPPAAGGAVGERTVTVVVDYTMNNPLPLAAMLNAWGDGNYDALGEIPIHGEATFRYEE